MAQPKVLITRGFIELEIEDFCQEYEVHVGSAYDFMDRSETLERIRDVDAVVIRHQDNPDREFIDAAPNLKIISNYGAGFETVDVEYATENGIWVSNTPGVLAESTADLTITLILCVLRRVTESERFVRAGEWTRYDPNDFHGTDPFGKKLGILGMGRIGREVATRARTFGMDIIYHNRRQLDEPIETEFEARYVSFDELLTTCDILCVQTPLTAETEYLIDRDEIARMKDGVFIINTARGQIVRESALAEGLRSGKVKAAGLDVHENEPHVHPEFLDIPNVTLLPHLGSATTETRGKMAALTLENVRLALAGQRPKTPVNEVERPRR